MSYAVIAFLFLATAPIHLLPSILALFLRCEGRGWVVAANLAIWVGFPVSSALNWPVHLGLGGALLLWLLLLRFVLTRTSSTTLDSGSAGSAAAGTIGHAALASPNTSLERTSGK